MPPFAYLPGSEFARRLDAADELAPFRAEFFVANPDLIYLDGNSLGRLPLRTQSHLAKVVENEWGDGLVRSWGRGWFDAPHRVGEKIAPLVGAAPGQVLVSDSTSANLFKLSLAALSLRPERREILSDRFNFPSDLYVLQGAIRLLGQKHYLNLLGTEDSMGASNPVIGAALSPATALLCLSHVVFKSGYLYPMAEITTLAHEAGALVLWDLSHSAGVVPIELDRWGVDLATGCTYKYLNGGPGAPAFLYVRRELQDSLLSPIWGWFGSQTPFSFELGYTPAPGVDRFQAGTPPILSLLAVEAGLDLVVEAGVERLRAKSVNLTEYLLALFDDRLAPLGFTLGTPRRNGLRGSHVSLRHPEGYRINRALVEEMQVIPDFREPDNLRLGFSPLYTTFSEVWEAVERLVLVVTEDRYLHYSSRRQAVT